MIFHWGLVVHKCITILFHMRACLSFFLDHFPSWAPPYTHPCHPISIFSPVLQYLKNFFNFTPMSLRKLSMNHLRFQFFQGGTASRSS